MQKIFVFALAALHAGAATAQSARQDPNDPRIKVPPAGYSSAFGDYRPFAEQETADWRKANEEVGAVGGHLGMSQQRQQPAAKPGASAPAAKGKAGHEGHK